MKQGYCDICDADTELEETGDMWLCAECSHDYWHIDLPDQKLFYIVRNVGMNMLVEPRRWQFSYRFILLEDYRWELNFELTEKQYKIYQAIWMPYWKLKQAIRRRKNGKR